MANSVWVKEDGGFQVQEEFLNRNKRYYDAEIFEAAFDADTANEINVLVFDAKWEETYDETDIHEGIFTISEDLQQDVKFMYSEESLYLEDESAMGFIKYYEGRDYAFVALLPKEGRTPSSVDRDGSERSV